MIYGLNFFLHLSATSLPWVTQDEALGLQEPFYEGALAACSACLLSSSHGPFKFHFNVIISVKLFLGLSPCRYNCQLLSVFIDFCSSLYYSMKHSEQRLQFLHAKTFDSDIKQWKFDFKIVHKIENAGLYIITSMRTF